MTPPERGCRRPTPGGPIARAGRPVGCRRQRHPNGRESVMSIARCLAALTLAMMTSAFAGAQLNRTAIASMPVRQLQQIYLECDRESARALLDMGTAAFCSTIAEE